MSNSNTNYLELGKISGIFGVKGWLKVYSYTQPMEQIIQYKKWHLQKDGVWHSVDIEQGRKSGKTVVVKIKNFNSIEESTALLGQKVAILRAQLPEQADSHYWIDLIGCKVQDVDGLYLGLLENLFETGANDVMEVRNEKGTLDLIPYIKKQVVISVDILKKEIIVDWDTDF